MYLDTGILVKLLTPEADTAWFELALRGQPLATSELALVEVKSALCAKERAGKVSRAQRMAAEEKFAEMINDEIVEIAELNSPLLRKAAHVIEFCHPEVPLRTLDALHVAACDLMQEFPLCTTDAQMRAAAGQMRIPVFPPTLPLNF